MVILKFAEFLSAIHIPRTDSWAISALYIMFLIIDFESRRDTDFPPQFLHILRMLSNRCFKYGSLETR